MSGQERSLAAEYHHATLIESTPMQALGPYQISYAYGHHAPLDQPALVKVAKDKTP